MRIPILQAILFTALVSCTGSGSGQVQYSGQAEVAPQLVEVSPGVQVVADYDEPVFYSENSYWRYDNGTWYRSPYHTRGWVRVETVPVAVRGIDQPTRYVHWHAGANVEAHENAVVVPQSHESHEAMEHAEHREEKAEHEQMKDEKEERKEAKEERKDAKEERKERKEDRKERKEERKHHD